MSEHQEDKALEQKKREERIAKMKGLPGFTLKGALEAFVAPRSTDMERATSLTIDQIREAEKIQRLAPGISASEESVLAIAQILAINYLAVSQRKN